MGRPRRKNDLLFLTLLLHKTEARKARQKCPGGRIFWRIDIGKVSDEFISGISWKITMESFPNC